MPNLWISKAEIDQQPISGSMWTNLLSAANATWPATAELWSINSVANRYVLAGALVYLRLDGVDQPTADAMRLKVSNYIQKYIDEGYTLGASNSGLGWARNGPMVVAAADCIDLATFNPTRNTAFRTFIRGLLTTNSNDPSFTYMLQGALRGNNIGASCRGAATSICVYLGDEGNRLTDLANLMRRWLGDLSMGSTLLSADWTGYGGNSINASLIWNSNQTWQLAQPSTISNRVGINAPGTRDGNFFDGIQPEDQRRNNPANYDPANFPNSKSANYVGGAAATTLGNIEVLRRAGYPAHEWADEAARRMVVFMKYLNDNHSNKGWDYFSDKHHAGAPLANWFYDLGYPEPWPGSHINASSESVFGTHYTHSGRTLSGESGLITRQVSGEASFSASIGRKTSRTLSAGLLFSPDLSPIKGVILDPALVARIMRDM